ncbi:MAG: FHA domain-containing protein [Bacteroidales bacterium]|nr:FHA domain-containing protein [Bacteroidales bacterium]
MANNYKNTVSGTIGAGFKSVLSGQGKKYYILEHKVSSKYHRAGESQEIIVDQIEIGRDPRCQVRFDESFATVSRRHAAIVRDGDNWKLVQISTTNKTFLNGVPVEKEWYLQNGDEIQLSVNGPKLGFIIPQGNKSTVNTIGLSRRLSLFRQQALRPYKTALWLLGILLLLAIGLGTFFIIRGNNINKQLREELAADSIAFHKKLESMSGTLNSMTRDYKTLLSQVKVKSGNRVSPIAPPTAGAEEFSKYVYYIQVVGYTIEAEGNVSTFAVGDEAVFDEGDEPYKVDGWIGTGFLLTDGKLVTSRHCVEAWYYDLAHASDWQILLNYLASQGARVTAKFVAVSPSGHQIKFSSSSVKCRRSGDHAYTLDESIITMAGNETFDALDYAWYETGLSGGLNYDSELSNSLPANTELKVYGFSNGWGIAGVTAVSATEGGGTVVVDGLENGMILVGDASFDAGHTGSPVLYTDEEGNYKVVGIVAARSQSHGFIVPISRIK